MKITKYSKRGGYHTRRKEKNQDFVFVKETSKVLIAAIADGATGSKEGAAAAKTACKAVVRLLQEGEFFAFSEKKTAFLIWEEVLFQIKKEAEEAGKSIEDYACTLSIACFYKKHNKLIIFNLGDGEVFVKKEKRYINCSVPIKQSEHCVLIPNKNAYEFATVRIFEDSSIKSVFMCTDGAKEFLLGKRMQIEQLVSDAPSLKSEDDLSFIEIKKEVNCFE